MIQIQRDNRFERTICGTIFPSKWDESNNITRIVIDTIDQDEYYIEQTKIGKELYRFIKNKVELTGIVGEDSDGNPVIRVNKYSLLDEDSENDNSNV